MSISPQDYTKCAAHGLLGEPNKALTTNSQLRFGIHDCIAVEFADDTGDARNGMPYFKIGSITCARKSTLLSWIEEQEETKTKYHSP